MAEQSFETAFQKLLKNEGGYVNHPNDPGGATNLGVTQRIYDAWRSQSNLVPQSVRDVTEDEARRIFRTMYWDKVGADSMPVGLDYALADFAYNSGPTRALRTLQKALGIDETGLWDEITNRAVSDPGLSIPNAITRLGDQRMAFLQGLPTWSIFGKGWANRVNEVHNSAQWASGNGGFGGFTLAGTPLESGYGGLGVTAAGYGQEPGYGFTPAMGPDFAAVFGPSPDYEGSIYGTQSTDVLKGGDSGGNGAVYLQPLMSDGTPFGGDGWFNEEERLLRQNDPGNPLLGPGGRYHRDLMNDDEQRMRTYDPQNPYFQPGSYYYRDEYGYSPSTTAVWNEDVWNRQREANRSLVTGSWMNAPAPVSNFGMGAQPGLGQAVYYDDPYGYQQTQYNAGYAAAPSFVDNYAAPSPYYVAPPAPSFADPGYAVGYASYPAGGGYSNPYPTSNNSGSPGGGGGGGPMTLTVNPVSYGDAW